MKSSALQTWIYSASGIKHVIRGINDKPAVQICSAVEYLILLRTVLEIKSKQHWRCDKIFCKFKWTKRNRARNWQIRRYRPLTLKNIREEQAVLLNTNSPTSLQYYIQPKSKEPIPTIACAKFTEEVLVWQALRKYGLRCAPFFTQGTVSADIILQNVCRSTCCLLSKSKMVIRYSGLIFVSAHYAKKQLTG